jgi:Na+/glutamate symporter
VLGALVVGGLLVWVFAGFVSFAFHVAEYVALAAAAGWVGYKLGYARGRRHHRQA